MLDKNMVFPRKCHTRTPGETRELAAELLMHFPATGFLFLALTGELGSGKTCFVQGLARAMGIRGPVTSPSFTLVNEYEGPGRKLVHADWYRLAEDADVEALGMDDALTKPAVVAIEWPERAAWWLPPGTVTICFRTGSDAMERIITLTRQKPASSRRQVNP